MTTDDIPTIELSSLPTGIPTGSTTLLAYDPTQTPPYFRPTMDQGVSWPAGTQGQVLTKGVGDVVLFSDIVIPAASTSKIGGVKLASGITSGDSGVTTGAQVYVALGQKMNKPADGSLGQVLTWTSTGAAYAKLPEAGEVQSGVVTVTNSVISGGSSVVMAGGMYNELLKKLDVPQGGSVGQFLQKSSTGTQWSSVAGVDFTVPHTWKAMETFDGGVSIRAGGCDSNGLGLALTAAGKPTIGLMNNGVGIPGWYSSDGCLIVTNGSSLILQSETNSYLKLDIGSGGSTSIKAYRGGVPGYTETTYLTDINVETLTKPISYTGELGNYTMGQYTQNTLPTKHAVEQYVQAAIAGGGGGEGLPAIPSDAFGPNNTAILTGYRSSGSDTLTWKGYGSTTPIDGTTYFDSINIKGSTSSERYSDDFSQLNPRAFVTKFQADMGITQNAPSPPSDSYTKTYILSCYGGSAQWRGGSSEVIVDGLLHFGALNVASRLDVKGALNGDSTASFTYSVNAAQYFRKDPTDNMNAFGNGELVTRYAVENYVTSAAGVPTPPIWSNGESVALVSTWNGSRMVIRWAGAADGDRIESMMFNNMLAQSIVCDANLTCYGATTFSYATIHGNLACEGNGSFTQQVMATTFVRNQEGPNIESFASNELVTRYVVELAIAAAIKK